MVGTPLHSLTSAICVMSHMTDAVLSFSRFAAAVLDVRICRQATMCHICAHTRLSF
jgi:hypothetical protein